MKLLQKIYAKELAEMQDCCLRTAQGDMREIKDKFKVKDVRMVHYLIWIGIVKPLDVVSNLDELQKDVVQLRK